MDIKQIRYISLPDESLRRRLLERLLIRVPYPSRLVPGVVYDPANPDFEPYTRRGIAEYVTAHPGRVKGVVGLWIANSRAIEDIVERDGVTVVLEDDFVCTSSFFDTARDMLARFDRPFDVIMFDCMGKPRDAHKIMENVYRTDGETFPTYWGSHVLFVNNRSIDRILEAKRNFTVMDVDGFFLHPGTGLEVYQFYTGKCRQLYFGSRVSHAARSRFTDLISVLTWHFWTRGFRPQSGAAPQPDFT
jgi:hypothetical protein